MFYTILNVIGPQASLSAEQVLLKYKAQEGKTRYHDVFSGAAAFVASVELTAAPSAARGLRLVSGHLPFLLQLKWPV